MDKNFNEQISHLSLPGMLGASVWKVLLVSKYDNTYKSHEVNYYKNSSFTVQLWFMVNYKNRSLDHSVKQPVNHLKRQ